MFESFPDWFQIFFGSMIPWVESRYIIPYAMWKFHLPWWQVFPIALAGNMFPIPFVLLFFTYVERFLRKFPFWAKTMDLLFEKTRQRADAKIRRYETIGLLLFVAVPLPFTGAWTGALIAYLFDLRFLKSFLTILLGVILAAIIMILLYSTGILLWSSLDI